MRKWLFAAIALAVLPWVAGCDKSAPAGPANPAVAPDADAADALAVEPVDLAAEPGPGPPPHPKPPLPPPKVYPHPKPLGPKPPGHFQPYAGHPYHGGQHGPWANYWLGHHHHGHHYLYGVYVNTWRGYTYRVWNGRWLYWSPADYCWYRYDEELATFIPVNPDGTDAIDTAPPPPPPPPPDK